MTNHVSDSRSSIDEAKKKRRRKNSEERRSKEDGRSEKNRTIVRTKTYGESQWSRATTDDESETKNDRAKTDERFGIWVSRDVGDERFGIRDSGFAGFKIWDSIRGSRDKQLINKRLKIYTDMLSSYFAKNKPSAMPSGIALLSSFSFTDFFSCHCVKHNSH